MVDPGRDHRGREPHHLAARRDVSAPSEVTGTRPARLTCSGRRRTAPWSSTPATGAGTPRLAHHHRQRVGGDDLGGVAGRRRPRRPHRPPRRGRRPDSSTSTAGAGRVPSAAAVQVGHGLGRRSRPSPRPAGLRRQRDARPPGPLRRRHGSGSTRSPPTGRDHQGAGLRQQLGRACGRSSAAATSPATDAPTSWPSGLDGSLRAYSSTGTGLHLSGSSAAAGRRSRRWPCRETSPATGSTTCMALTQADQLKVYPGRAGGTLGLGRRHRGLGRRADPASSDRRAGPHWRSGQGLTLNRP